MCVGPLAPKPPKISSPMALPPPPVAPPPPDPVTDTRVPELATPQQAKTIREKKSRTGTDPVRKKRGKSGLRIPLSDAGTTSSGLNIPAI